MGTQRLSVVVGKRVAVMNVEVKIIRRQGHMLISDFELTLKKFTATTNAETNMTSYQGGKICLGVAEVEIRQVEVGKFAAGVWGPD